MKSKLLRKLESAAIRRGWKMIRHRVFRKQVAAALRKPLPPVLVYQMAKVASRGVADALAGRPDLSVFHLHFCEPENSAYNYRQLFGEEGLKRGETDSAVFGRVIHERLVKPRHKAFVITLVREPIARNISSYFHNLNIIWRQRDAYANVPFESLVEGLLTKHMNELPLEWFDREFKAALGVDLYAHTFPREQGFLSITEGPYKVLVMRHDLDNRLKERCVGELIGIQDVTIRPANRAADQPYADVYKHFVENVRLPESYVAEMLDSKYTRHFYTGEEIERLREKWLRRTQGD